MQIVHNATFSSTRYSQVSFYSMLLIVLTHYNPGHAQSRLKGVPAPSKSKDHDFVST